jgi:hypothetical protein
MRAVRLLESRGFTVGSVEHWIPRTRIRRDLFGFADLVAFAPSAGIFLVQVTTHSNRASRRTKILESPAFPGWCAAGGRVMLLTFGDAEDDTHTEIVAPAAVSPFDLSEGVPPCHSATSAPTTGAATAPA